MFNLFRSQKKTVRLLLGGILMMVALSMVITFIPGIFDSSQANTSDPVLIEVGEDAVRIRDVQLRLRDYSRTGQVPPESLAFMARQIVDNVLLDKVLMQEAAALGLTPTEAELAEWIRNQMPFLFEGGRFIGADQYRALIQQRFQRSVEEFETELLKDLAIEMRLREMVTDPIVMTEEDVKKSYRRRNENAQIEWVAVEAAQFAAQVKLEEEKLKEYFESNKFRYLQQEKRTIKVVELDDSALPPAEIPEAVLRNFYDQNRYRFETVERLQASHILFMTLDKSDEEIAEIEKKAREVLEKVGAGEDFAALARENSEDTGNAEKGGDLGWVTRGQMVENFEKATFLLQPGEVSDVVKTEYGFHIIKVFDREAGVTKSFADARDEIVADLSEERRASSRLERIDQAAAALSEAADIDQAAAELGAAVVTYENVTRSGPPPELGENPVLVGQAFSAAQGEVITVASEEGPTKIAVVTGIFPSRDATFEEVEDRVAQDYVMGEARRLAAQRAEELIEKARAEGADLRKVAARYGLKTRLSAFFKRGDSVEDFSPAQALGEIPFTAELGTIGGPVRMGEKVGVYRVAARREADMTEYFDQRTQVRAEFLQARQNEAFNMYKAWTLQKWEAEGKIVRHDDRIAEYLRLLRAG